jgi:hypothetical protein
MTQNSDFLNLEPFNITNVFPSPPQQDWNRDCNELQEYNSNFYTENITNLRSVPLPSPKPFRRIKRSRALDTILNTNFPPPTANPIQYSSRMGNYQTDKKSLPFYLT